MSNVRCWNCGKPFCSNGALLLRVTEGSFSGCSFLRPSEPWPLMPRKGWSTLEVPDGWLQVIRGPRPPAVRWPQRFVVVDGTGHRTQTEKRPTREVRRRRKFLFPRFVEATTSLSSCSGASCAFTVGSGRIGSQDVARRSEEGTTGGDFAPRRRATRRLCPICRESQERFEWRLPSRSANHRPNLKKLVTEFRCHVAFLEENKPDNWQGLEELWKLRREVEIFDISGTKPDGQSRWSWPDPGSMNPSTRMATLIDAGDVKRRCVENPPP